MTDEARNFPKVHEGHEVEMAVSLALEHDCWRQALIAHAERERLVVGTVVVDFVAVGLHGRASLAALVGSMGALALLLHLEQVVLKRLVLALDQRLCFWAVGALLAHGVVALVLDKLRSILCHIQAVHALAIGTVSAVAFLHLVVGERVLEVGRRPLRLFVGPHHVLRGRRRSRRLHELPSRCHVALGSLLGRRLRCWLTLQLGGCLQL